ncbi:4-hydroxyphenylpyruvate dioxygenase [Kitasatospora sp. NPDC052868]|uniref:4-hydroxyphenylpyruvate dioxygenase n=1 Tax=Kitasatospora sp. NPDC052868 TaxID=3364060 RepID=UPI0037CAD871
MGQETFEGMLVDHIACYVADLAVTTAWLVDGYGLEVYAGSPPQAPDLRSVALGRNGIRVLLSQPLVGDHPGAAYVEKHGDGVADIALRVPDARAAFAAAVGRGARPVAQPAEHGELVTATVMGVGDIAHTFVQRTARADERQLPGLEPVQADPAGRDCGLQQVDHFAICVEPGQIDATVAFYREALDFELVFTERIEANGQAMITKVVQNGAVIFTLIEPDQAEVSGHLDEFLKDHGGPGVQHIAFTTPDIVTSVAEVAARGIEFLTTPEAYYRLLSNRLTPLRHSEPELERLNILIDQDHDGQLFQIFARSVHARGTLFLEIIERRGARSFGSGNIKALYQAIEHQKGRGAADGA